MPRPADSDSARRRRHGGAAVGRAATASRGPPGTAAADAHWQPEGHRPPPLPGGSPPARRPRATRDRDGPLGRARARLRSGPPAMPAAPQGYGPQTVSGPLKPPVPLRARVNGPPGPGPAPRASVAGGPPGSEEFHIFGYRLLQSGCCQRDGGLG